MTWGEVHMQYTRVGRIRIPRRRRHRTTQRPPARTFLGSNDIGRWQDTISANEQSILLVVDHGSHNNAAPAFLATDHLDVSNNQEREDGAAADKCETSNKASNGIFGALSGMSTRRGCLSLDEAVMRACGSCVSALHRRSQSVLYITLTCHRNIVHETHRCT
jgi:hypothetical protein